MVSGAADVLRWGVAEAVASVISFCYPKHWSVGIRQHRAISNASRTGCGPSGPLGRNLRRSCDADDPDVKANLTCCAHGGVERLEPPG